MPIQPQDIVQTGSLELLAKKAVEGFITGFHKSPFQGYSVEFAEHRQYNMGESTKHIDWKLYARTDKLYNKQYDDETNLRCHFLVDVSSSMQIKQAGLLTKLQFALYVTASFLELLRKQRDASSLCLFDNQVREFTKVSSSSRHYRELFTKMEEYLTFSSQNKRTDISQTLHQIASQVQRRGLIILFTDFFDHNPSNQRLFDAIRHLKHNKHEVIVFHVLHHDTELHFDFGTTPLHLEDAETGERLKVLPSEIAPSYREAMTHFTTQLVMEFQQYKIDYIPINTANSVEEAIIPFLTKRKRMRA